LAELSSVLRPGPNAERGSARGYRWHERRRFIGDRLALGAISQRRPAGLFCGLSYSLLILRCRPRRRPRCCSLLGWVCFGGPAWHHLLAVWLPRFSAPAIWRPCSVYPSLCIRLARRGEPGVAA